MRLQRTRAHDVRPLVVVTQSFQRLIALGGEDGYGPRVVVTWQRQQRDRAKRCQRRSPAWRLSAGEVARVIGKTGIRLLLCGGRAPRATSHCRCARLSPGGIDDQIGLENVAAVSADAGHVRSARTRRQDRLRDRSRARRAGSCTRRVQLAALANTHSPTGRRAVYVHSLSSMGRGDRSGK